MNPYQTLGLDPEYRHTPEAIEAAHRKLRKEAHPDRPGGSAERMTELNMARDILLNPERKRRFDELGSTESGALTIEDQAAMIIGQLFQGAMEQAPDDMSTSKILGIIAQEIVQGLAKAKEHAVQLPRVAKRLDRMAKKFDCNPLLRKALVSRQLAISRSQTEVNQQIACGEMMLTMMKSIKFK